MKGLKASQTLRGSNQRDATPDTYFRPPGRPCRKESQTISLIPFRIPWIATAVGCQSTHARLRSPRLLQGNRPPCLQEPLEPETTAGQPVYKSSWNPRPLRATSPRVCKSSLTWSHRGQPALVTTTGLSARDHCRATGPRVYKSSSTGPSGDNQSRRNPDLPVSFKKK